MVLHGHVDLPKGLELVFWVDYKVLSVHFLRLNFFSEDLLLDYL